VAAVRDARGRGVDHIPQIPMIVLSLYKYARRRDRVAGLLLTFWRSSFYSAELSPGFNIARRKILLPQEILLTPDYGDGMA